MNWCKYRDTDFTFYHGCIKARIQKNRIYGIQNSQGIKIKGFDQVGKATEPEDIEHLFFKCEYSATVLKIVNDKYQCKIPESGTWTWLARRKMGKLKKKGLCLISTTLVYAMWNERNAGVHGGAVRTATQIAIETILTITSRLKCIAKENEQMKFLQ
ncbi:hypothetical protein Cgig2_018605 [Carnegiea gigantea]|uniref:Uncharacterized protein n=1 Tax=Carnegiea gigantea TaxID=171969 RepID=A0A9Q1QHU5_9CARY|nr:hypothetical protein Cgig2_018605 [Carnegiea gigantea]